MGIMRDTIDILKTIVSIPSYVDEQNNEEKLIDYIKEFVLDNAPDLKIVDQPVEGKRRNLIITGSEEVSTVLFGHMDTVLPKEETDQPFSPRVEDGKLFGLGSADMKSGLAIMLDIIKSHHRPGVGYVFTVDEEYEFKGAIKLKSAFNLKPKLIINIEPTNLKILNGCRGITEFNFVVKGKSVHAGRKKYGINAIEKGVELVAKLQEDVSKFDSEDRGNTSINLAYLHGGMLKGKNSDGTPILSDLGLVVPNYAYLNCEIRVASDRVSKEYVSKRLIELGNEIGVVVSDVNFKFYIGSMLTDKSALKGFEDAVTSVGRKVEYGDINNAGYYEVQMLQEVSGSNCVIFGAGPTEMSHAANEYVLLESIEDTQDVIESYIDANHPKISN
jgi:acetylornithine deacetylase/succinyl-diaminopimelate desuccinylase-like protein